MPACWGNWDKGYYVNLIYNRKVWGIIFTKFPGKRGIVEEINLVSDLNFIYQTE